MKKIIFFSASLLLFTAASAEELQFVTTISPPVGSFAHLDAADSTHVTTAPILNFCNTRSSAGKIAIKGAGAYLKQIDIQNGTALGSTNTPEYRLGEKLTIENGGTVTAGRVMANDVTFKDTNFHKSKVTNTIYGNDVAVMGGKTDNMEITSTAKITKGSQTSSNLGKEMEWSNEYQCDYNSSQECKTPKYTSYLLKSKARVSTGGGGDSGSGGNTCEDDTNRVTCESCGGTWSDSKCACDCGWYQGNSCQFNPKRGCVCGNLVKACR